LKIAFVIQTFFPHVGGTEQQLLTLLPLLRERGLETVVITRRLPNTTAVEVIDGTVVYRCYTLPGRQLSSVCFTLFALVRLFMVKPNCTHAFQLLSPLTIAILFRTISGIPILCKVQGGGPLGDVSRVKAKLFSKLRIKWLKTRVDSYQVISNEIFHELSSLGVPETKLKAIPNGVVLDSFVPVRNTDIKNKLRAKLKLAPSDLVFVAVGRLVKLKNLDLLIKGFLGKRDDIGEILQASDVLVHTSASEGQSNAICEALATGLAVLATNVGAAEDQIRPEHNGWLIEPNNQQQLITALRAAILSVDKLPQMGRYSRALMEEKYNIDDTAQHLVEEYQRLASR